MGEPTKKRYLVFAYADYYPSGGLNDVSLATNSIPEIERWATENCRWDCYEVLDMETGQTLDLVWHNGEAKVLK